MAKVPIDIELNAKDRASRIIAQTKVELKRLDEQAEQNAAKQKAREIRGLDGGVNVKKLDQSLNAIKSTLGGAGAVGIAIAGLRAMSEAFKEAGEWSDKLGANVNELDGAFASFALKLPGVATVLRDVMGDTLPEDLLKQLNALESAQERLEGIRSRTFNLKLEKKAADPSAGEETKFGAQQSAALRAQMDSIDKQIRDIEKSNKQAYSLFRNDNAGADAFLKANKTAIEQLQEQKKLVAEIGELRKQQFEYDLAEKRFHEEHQRTMRAQAYYERKAAEAARAGRGGGGDEGGGLLSMMKDGVVNWMMGIEQWWKSGPGPRPVSPMNPFAPGGMNAVDAIAGERANLADSRAEAERAAMEAAQKTAQNTSVIAEAMKAVEAGIKKIAEAWGGIKIGIFNGDDLGVRR